MSYTVTNKIKLKAKQRRRKILRKLQQSSVQCLIVLMDWTTWQWGNFSRCVRCSPRICCCLYTILGLGRLISFYSFVELYCRVWCGMMSYNGALYNSLMQQNTCCHIPSYCFNSICGAALFLSYINTFFYHYLSFPLFVTFSTFPLS